MTTNVPKGAGRAAHKARTERHAQRTPLPPRRTSSPGTESITSLLGGLAAPARKGAAKKAQPAKAKATSKAATPTEKPAKAARGATAKPVKATKTTKKVPSKPVAAAEASPQAKTQAKAARPRATTRGTSSAPSPVETLALQREEDADESRPGPTKAAMLAAWAREHGWEVEMIPLPDQNGGCVSCTRGGELIDVHFLDNKLDVLQMPTYTVGSRTVKLRNVSAARKQMLVPADEALAAIPSARRERKPREKHDDDRGAVVLRRRIPWAEDASDEEIILAVIGRKLIWRNTIAGTYDEGHVLPIKEQKQLKVVVAPNGKRTLNWASSDGGFRSVYIENIVQVR